MNSKDELLKVLIIYRPQSENTAGLVSRVENILDNRFKSVVKKIYDINELATSFYLILPHFIILDPSNREALKRLDRQNHYLKPIRQKPFLVIRTPDLNENEISRLASSSITFLDINSSDEDIEKCISSMAGNFDFSIKKGKILNRLVKTSVRVFIKLPAEDGQIQLPGKTTGLNKNGLGTRVKLENMTFSDIQEKIGKKCRVAFHEADLWFMPVDGTILRVEESREGGFDAFMAVKFSEDLMYFDKKELESLEKLIKNQQDKSIIKQLLGSKKEKK